jgi:hypothetical protein
VDVHPPENVRIPEYPEAVVPLQVPRVNKRARSKGPEGKGKPSTYERESGKAFQTSAKASPAKDPATQPRRRRSTGQYTDVEIRTSSSEQSSSESQSEVQKTSGGNTRASGGAPGSSGGQPRSASGDGGRSQGKQRASSGAAGTSGPLQVNQAASSKSRGWSKTSEMVDFDPLVSTCFIFHDTCYFQPDLFDFRRQPVK